MSSTIRPRTAVAVDATGFSGNVGAGATRLGNADVRVTDFHSLEQLVTQLEADVKKNGPLTQLNLYDHGAPGTLEIGDDHLQAMDLSSNPDIGKAGPIDLVQRLGKLMAPGGVIELHSCNVAEGESGQYFMQRLADVTGVTVRGPVNAQSAFVPALQGTTVECQPQGPCTTTQGSRFSDGFDAVVKKMPW